MRLPSQTNLLWSDQRSGNKKAYKSLQDLSSTPTKPDEAEFSGINFKNNVVSSASPTSILQEMEQMEKQDPKQLFPTSYDNPKTVEDIDAKLEELTLDATMLRQVYQEELKEMYEEIKKTTFEVEERQFELNLAKMKEREATARMETVKKARQLDFQKALIKKLNCDILRLCVSQNDITLPDDVDFASVHGNSSEELTRVIQALEEYLQQLEHLANTTEDDTRKNLIDKYISEKRSEMI